MKSNNWQKGLFIVLVVGMALVFGSTPASATHDPFPSAPGGIAGNGYVQDLCHDFSKCGYNGPLMFMPFTVVSSGLAWKSAHWETPVLHGTRRHSEVGQNDVYDATCINELVSGNGRVNDGIVDPIYGGPYPAPYSSWPVSDAEWLATFPRSTTLPYADPGGNIFISNNNTTAAPPAKDNYGVAANGPSNNQGGGMYRCLRSSFKQLMYGGKNQRQGQTQNLAQRLKIIYDRNTSGSTIWDFTHPDAFKQSCGDVRVTEANAGAPLSPVCKKDSVTLSEADAVAIMDSYRDVSYNTGLGYNLYSLGLVTFANGMLGQVGGHDKQSNNGYRKMNILDPESETWIPRPYPCQRVLWEGDRYGVALGYKAVADAVAGAPDAGESLINPPSMALNGVDAPDWYGPTPCNQNDSGYNDNPNSADPSHSSDMRYWRWYPTSLMLPNGMAVTVAGDDRDDTLTPDTSVANFGGRDNAFNASTIQVPVMDVYLPREDRHVHLENARKVYPLYPMVANRETGPGWDDWDMCTVGGESAPAITGAPEFVRVPRTDQIDEAQYWRDTGCASPGCALDQRTVRTGAGGDGGAALDCLDILGAMNDPNVNVPAENHWTHIDRAHNRYPYSDPMIDYTVIGENGQTQSHRLFLFGGNQPTGVGDPFTGNGRLIETIELSDGNGGPHPNPQFSIWGRLVQTSGATHAQAMPDGNIFVSGGGGAGSANNVVDGIGFQECGVTIGGPCGPSPTTYSRGNNFRNQIVCVEPASYCELGPGTVQVVGQMTVQRAGIHGVYHTLPTGEILQSAYDRTALTTGGDRYYSPGDADAGLNSSQIFTPPYLYDSSVPCPNSIGCKLAKRPVIHKGPDHIGYGKKFNLHVDDADAIKMVSMMRTGSATHTLAQDQLYVRVPFKVKNDKTNKGKGKGKAYGNNIIEVSSPSKPVQAKPGDYMLFIVNDKGTPSVAKHVRLGDEQYVHVPATWAKGHKGKGK